MSPKVKSILFPFLGLAGLLVSMATSSQNAIPGEAESNLRPQGQFLIDTPPPIPTKIEARFDPAIRLDLAHSDHQKLRLNASWDTQATFQFENNPDSADASDEILQKIERGNVSLPLNDSVIKASKNLFGIRNWRGPLPLLARTQEPIGRSDTVTVRFNTGANDFRMQAFEYDYNQHFFLSHYFRSRYEFALQFRPRIDSSLVITGLQVWVTNNNSSLSVNHRNAVGFLDLGESSLPPDSAWPEQKGRIWNPDLAQKPSFPDNKANDLHETLNNNPLFSDKSTVETALTNALRMENGIDFLKIENMRMLNANEYTYDPHLGCLSLNHGLQKNQVLFVAYEYHLGSKVYQVGDFSTDPGKYANELNSNVLFLKMLRPDRVMPSAHNLPYPTWDLMMKNIYSIGGYGIHQNDFQLEIVYDSRSAAGDLAKFPSGPLKETPLIQVFGLDDLQADGKAGHDNAFDYIEGISICSEQGRIIFPNLEPFGDHLCKQWSGVAEGIERYVFDTLYAVTPEDALNDCSEKCRYFLVGSYSSSMGSFISLNSINVLPGSVSVFANGIPLLEGCDYSVNYNICGVKILNKGILTSGQEVMVTFSTSPKFQDLRLVPPHPH